MQVGHMFFTQQQDARNASIYRDTTAHIEGAVLLTVAIVGGVGNLIIFGATATCSFFRTSSCAFLSHHCLLDSIKSAFCVPFACALLLEMDIPYCSALGAAYIFLMTLTAYNLLAIHINEEYHLYDRDEKIAAGQQHYLDKKNSLGCVSFGIFMIWFTTVLLHLGVAFLPSSAHFSYDIGNCVFNYGTPKSYVIHVLWTILVTAALVIAIICFALFFCKLRARMRSDKWALLHSSIAMDQSQHSQKGHATDDTVELHNDAEELHYEFSEGSDQLAAQRLRLCLRRVVVMLLMVVSFLLFWYPLFTLTIMDVSFAWPPQAYRLCMIVAWAHPVTTPLFCGAIYFDMLHARSLAKSMYSAAIPMRDSTSFSSATLVKAEARQRIHQRYKMHDVGFANENFYFYNHASPRNAQRDELQERSWRQPHEFCEQPHEPDEASADLMQYNAQTFEYEEGFDSYCLIHHHHYHADGGKDHNDGCCEGGEPEYEEPDSEQYSLPIATPMREACSRGQPSLKHICRGEDSRETLIM